MRSPWDPVCRIFHCARNRACGSYPYNEMSPHIVFAKHFVSMHTKYAYCLYGKLRTRKTRNFASAKIKKPLNKCELFSYPGNISRPSPIHLHYRALCYVVKATNVKSIREFSDKSAGRHCSVAKISFGEALHTWVGSCLSTRGLQRKETESEPVLHSSWL